VAKENYLDISIESVDKFFSKAKNKSRIEEFLSSITRVEQKTDGVKVTAYKVASNGDINDWIISYKGNILYDGEFSYGNLSNIKNSVGSSQFKVVIDHFKKISGFGRIQNMNEGLELKLEFLMNKPTLSSNYIEQHAIVLISYCHSVVNKTKLQHGIFKSTISKHNDIVTTSFKKMRFYFSQDFYVYTPKLLKNLNSKNLEDLKKYLDEPSEFGGKEEGVVIFSEGFPPLKLQQAYQNDQAARRAIKLKYQEDTQDREDLYWRGVQLRAKHLFDTREDESASLQDQLKELSSKLQYLSYPVSFKRNSTNMMDDVQLTCKQLIIRYLDGNDNALIIGKFRVFTKAHEKIVRDGLFFNDGVKIAIVSNKETKKQLEIRTKMIENTFKEEIKIGRVELTFCTTGNLFTIINRFDDNINTVICGSDRREGYEKQLEKSQVEVNYQPRDEDSINNISATKVLEALSENDIEYYTKNISSNNEELHEQVKQAYGI